MVYVLEINGKHETVDGMTLYTFESYNEAHCFVEENSSPEEKYYRCLEIIEPYSKYCVHGSYGEDNPAEIYKDY